MPHITGRQGQQDIWRLGSRDHAGGATGIINPQFKVLFTIAVVGKDCNDSKLTALHLQSRSLFPFPSTSTTLPGASRTGQSFQILAAAKAQAAHSFCTEKKKRKEKTPTKHTHRSMPTVHILACH